MNFSTPERDIYTVTRLNQEANQLLQSHFPLIWLQGELSNLAQPRSGHWYFSLKDEQAQIRAAMFRNRNQYLRFKLTEGMQVLVRARIGLYEPRGDYQLIVEHMEEAGEGALRRAFEQLKNKLAAEGLFADQYKKRLPRFPKRVGVITSASGAALRDVLSVLQRRFPLLPVLIYPVPVQGDQATPAITAALALADARSDCDVLLLVRGGGSLEDLQPFNTESLARAIHACKIPLVAGIGHEIDFTIADFVADHRAATPSAAAELVSPDAQEWTSHIVKLQSRLQTLFAHALLHLRQQLNALQRHLHLLHPVRQLHNQMQRLDELENRLLSSLRQQLQRCWHDLQAQHIHLQRFAPQIRLAILQNRYTGIAQRLSNEMQRRLLTARQRLAIVTHTLDAVSPLATLQRGYAIVSKLGNHELVKSCSQLVPRERIVVRLADGCLHARIEDKLIQKQ